MNWFGRANQLGIPTCTLNHAMQYLRPSLTEALMNSSDSQVMILHVKTRLDWRMPNILRLWAVCTMPSWPYLGRMSRRLFPPGGDTQDQLQTRLAKGQYVALAVTRQRIWTASRSGSGGRTDRCAASVQGGRWSSKPAWPCESPPGPSTIVSCDYSIKLLTKAGPRCISLRCKSTVSLAQGAVHDAEADVADPVFVRSTINFPSVPNGSSTDGPLGPISN